MFFCRVQDSASLGPHLESVFLARFEELVDSGTAKAIMGLATAQAGADCALLKTYAAMCSLVLTRQLR